MAGKGDNIIYATFKTVEDLNEIYIRTAECNNEDLVLR